MYTTKNNENIDMWMDNVNQYSRADLMQTKLLMHCFDYYYICMRVGQ